MTLLTRNSVLADLYRAGVVPREDGSEVAPRRWLWAAAGRLPGRGRPNALQRAVGLPAQDRHLRKQQQWEPDWDHYARF